MQRKQKNFDRVLLSIIAEGFLSRLSFGLISFALPLYAYHFGMSLNEIGLLVSLRLAAAVALKPIMGCAADRFGLKRSLTAAIGLRSLIALLLAFAGSVWQLFSIRIGHGLSTSLRDPAVNTLIAEHSGSHFTASAFAWYQTAKSLAGAVGKAIAGILLTLTASNFSLVFIVAFFLSILPIFLIARYVPERSKRDKAAADGIPGVEVIPDCRAVRQSRQVHPTLLPFMGLGFLISSVAQMMQALFPIFATKYVGLSESQTGIIYLVSIFVILFFGPLFGWLSDNISRKLVLMVRGGANTVSSIVYLIASNFLGLATGKIMDDMGKAAFRPAWGALMAHVSSFNQQRRARTMAFLSMGEDAGSIVGPILAGFLWSTWGISVMLGTRILLAVITEAYAVAINISLRKPKGIRSRADITTGNARKCDSPP